MQGFDFFIRYRNSRLLVSRYSTQCKMRKEEAQFLASVYQLLKSSVSTLEDLLSVHLEADLAFVTAFLTGKNDEEGEQVGKKENRFRNKKLSQVIKDIGYSYIDVSGHYGAPEDTFCVINYAEDTRRFINDMKGLAQLYNQKGALIVPRKGREEELPFLYYSETNDIQYAESDEIEVLSRKAKDFFTKIGHQRFSYSINPNKPRVSTVARFFIDLEKTLYPIRSGYAGGWVSSTRVLFRKGVSDLFGWNDRDYFTLDMLPSSITLGEDVKRRESIKSSYLTQKIDGLDTIENLNVFRSSEI